MRLPKLSLQALEVFEQVAQSGSMQLVARDMGLSISSVSHYVARLEDELGVILLDRTSRPFALTREGRETLHHLSIGLRHLRRATSETAIGGLLGTRSLRIGIVEDFESNVAPDLAVVLAGRMPQARLAIRHVLSHEAPGLVLRGDLDIAIASEALDQAEGLVVEPIVRDPFVLATPSDAQVDVNLLLKGEGDLNFLRFNPNHMIGKQIDAHLARHRITLPDRIALDSVQSIMAVIANGDGWSIITPLGFARAQRYAARVRLRPLPLASFARQISLISRPDFDQATAQVIASHIRQSVRQVVVDPICAAYPSLSGSFVVAESEG